MFVFVFQRTPEQTFSRVLRTDCVWQELPTWTRGMALCASWLPLCTCFWGFSSRQPGFSCVPRDPWKAEEDHSAHSFHPALSRRRWHLSPPSISPGSHRRQLTNRWPSSWSWDRGPEEDLWSQPMGVMRRPSGKRSGQTVMSKMVANCRAVRTLWDSSSAWHPH